MRILIDNEAFLWIMETWKYMFVLDIRGKHNFKLFYYIHIVEIPTNKSANSYKLKR